MNQNDLLKKKIATKLSKDFCQKILHLKNINTNSESYRQLFMITAKYFILKLFITSSIIKTINYHSDKNRSNKN